MCLFNGQSQFFACSPTRINQMTNMKLVYCYYASISTIWDYAVGGHEFYVTMKISISIKLWTFNGGLWDFISIAWNLVWFFFRLSWNLNFFAHKALEFFFPSLWRNESLILCVWSPSSHLLRSAYSVAITEMEQCKQLCPTKMCLYCSDFN